MAEMSRNALSAPYRRPACCTCCALPLLRSAAPQDFAQNKLRLFVAAGLGILFFQLV